MNSIDLYGNDVLYSVYWCVSCKTYLPEWEFYLESEENATIFKPKRCQCKTCWNKFNGKTKPRASTTSFSFDQFVNVEIAPKLDTVLDIVKHKFINGGVISYDGYSRKLIFETQPYVECVYCIIDLADNKIYKFGKADGEQGLNSRTRKYEIEEYMHEQLIGPLENKTLSLMYYPIEPKYNIGEFGYNLKYQASRDLEKQFSRQARKEKHPMSLSKVD